MNSTVVRYNSPRKSTLRIPHGDVVSEVRRWSFSDAIFNFRSTFERMKYIQDQKSKLCQFLPIKPPNTQKALSLQTANILPPSPKANNSRQSNNSNPSYPVLSHQTSASLTPSSSYPSSSSHSSPCLSLRVSLSSCRIRRGGAPFQLLIGRGLQWWS